MRRISGREKKKTQPLEKLEGQKCILLPLFMYPMKVSTFLKYASEMGFWLARTALNMQINIFNMDELFSSYYQIPNIDPD